MRRGGEEEEEEERRIPQVSVPSRQDLNNLIPPLNNLLTYLHREVHGECPLPDKIANGSVGDGVVGLGVYRVYIGCLEGV